MPYGDVTGDRKTGDCHRRAVTVTSEHDWLRELASREEGRFRDEHPRSSELAARARAHLLAGVPMHWMAKWPGGFPVFVAEAYGSHFVDVDGHEYVDTTSTRSRWRWRRATSRAC